MAENSNGTDKYERLHQLALSLQSSGNHESALRCWNKIKSENPGFPEINNLVSIASEATLNDGAGNKSISPSVYRTQKRIIDHFNQRKSTSFQFHPIRDHKPRRRILRHRHIAFLLLIGFCLFLVSSLRNKRAYLLVLEPDTGIVQCYQGTFFPYGWQRPEDINIGLEPGWETSVSDENLRRDLVSGMRLEGAEEFDETLIKLFQHLGQNALKKHDIDSQRKAIYYFKQIEKADFTELIAWDIATAWQNFILKN